MNLNFSHEPVTANMTVFTEGHMEGIGNKEFPVARL